MQFASHSFVGPAVRLALVGAIGTFCGPALAHPHVFVDGGADFEISEGGSLERIRVTWRYDAFETLYILSDLNVLPMPGSDFSDQSRVIVEAALGDFPPDFDGSVHIRIDGMAVPLDWPRDLSAQMVGDRLEVTFLRDLAQPVLVRSKDIHVGFYERTYFFKFSLTDAPAFGAAGDSCTSAITPFEPSQQTAEIRAALARLGREETPEDSNAGALLADRMVISCE